MFNNNPIGNRLKQILRLDRAVRFVWAAGPGWTLAGLVLLALQGVLPLVTLYLMKMIVDAVTATLTVVDRSIVFEEVVWLIIVACGVALFANLLKMLNNLVKEAQAAAVNDYMYSVLHSQSVAVDLAYYENPAYFDTLHQAQREGPYRPLRIVEGLMQLAQNGISLVAVTILLISFHWAVALILCVVVCPGILVRIRHAGKLYRWRQDRTAMERRAEYYNWILTGDTHAKEVRLFGLGDLFIQRFKRLRGKLRREKIQLARNRAIEEFLAQIVAVLAVFGALGLVAYRTVHGMITLGDMVMYYQAFQRGMEYFRSILGGMADLYENSLFLSNFHAFLAIEPQVAEPREPGPVPRPLKTGFVLDRVGFAYPGHGKTVLEQISLTIAPGEVVALVGANGAGKTTLIKLICRLYDPESGCITMDGIDLREFNTLDLRNQISVIFQDYARYQLSAKENIQLGNSNLAPNDKHIEESARQSGAHDVIAGLPRGYDTVLGHRFEDGRELSTGEWQKVALARAFVRDAQLIVLDEPTSAMDAATEYEVFKGMRRLLQGRAAILISHRFSTVRMADTIVVLEKGCIVEKGSHDDLMGLNGKYARMFTMQADNYR